MRKRPICGREASSVGAEISRERIPVFPGLLDSGLSVRDAVLNGGEEYALLFTSLLRESELSTRLGRPVYAIGKIVEGWPRNFDTRRAEALGFKAESSMDEIIRAHVEDELGGKIGG